MRLSKKEFKQMSMNNVINRCEKLLSSYSYIYDDYENTNSRDSAFLIDVVRIIDTLIIPLEVYARDKSIHPGYALEKLEHAQRVLNSICKYYESKNK